MDTGIDAVKIASKKVVLKAGGFLWNKVADPVTTSSDNKIKKQEPVEEIIIPLEKREETSNKLRNVLWKWNKMNYLNN